MSTRRNTRKPVARNAIEPAIQDEFHLLPSEDDADFQKLIDSYYYHYSPATPEAAACVDQLIQYEWLLRRYRIQHTQLQWHIDNAIHAFRQALDSLHKVRGDPPSPDPIPDDTVPLPHLIN